MNLSFIPKARIRKCERLRHPTSVYQILSFVTEGAPGSRIDVSYFLNPEQSSEITYFTLFQRLKFGSEFLGSSPCPDVTIPTWKMTNRDLWRERGWR